MMEEEGAEKKNNIDRRQFLVPQCEKDTGAGKCPVWSGKQTLGWEELYLTIYIADRYVL